MPGAKVVDVFIVFVVFLQDALADAVLSVNGVHELLYKRVGL